MVESSETRRNIEIKARVADEDRLRDSVVPLADHRLPDQWQRDTYFPAHRGRLKLRELRDAGGEAAAQLIWYDRPDQAAARRSDYTLVPIADAPALRDALERAWGIRAVVEKDREIHLYRNVRIHLDRVVGLGTFLELEAVVGPEADEHLSRQRLEWLLERLAIHATDIEKTSYVDLQAAAAARRENNNRPA